MTVALIWAQAANGVIGRDGTLPWSLPEDLAHFRSVTAGSTVLMGRHTWESLPARFRPLPGRRNLVLTRQPALAGAEVYADIEDALTGPDDIWVIGGAAVYAAALPRADRLVVTELEHEFMGDVLAPVIGAEWTLTDGDPAPDWSESVVGLRYRILDYRRAR
jgi:dihydrofolate reductase